MSEANTVPAESIDFAKLHEDVVNAIRTIYDPEIPVNIYDLGLIYSVVVNEDLTVDVKMTLTSPACPEAQSLPPSVEMEVAAVEGIKGARVEVVWDPPWGPELMGEDARLALGMDVY